MAMNYGMVRSSFWTGATGRALRRDVDAQVVGMYLMTSPHANIIGVYRCPVEYISIETGRGFEGASKGLQKLHEIGFSTYDPETETIWVHEMARHQIGDALKAGDNRLKHIARFFGEIENSHIKQAFFEKYGAAYHLPQPPPPAGLASPFEGASKPLRSPFEATNTNTVTNTGTSVPSERSPISTTDKPEQDLFSQGKQVAYHLQEPPVPAGLASLFEGTSKPLQSPFEATNTNTNTATNTGTSVPPERAPISTPDDPDRELFSRGKQVLGKSAGGQIVKLKAAKGGNVALARAAIERASTKENPSEYIAAVIRGGAGPPMFTERHTNGFVAVMEERSREKQNDQSQFGSRIELMPPDQPGRPDGIGSRARLVGRG